MLPASKPYGPRVVPGGNTKIKGAVILQAIGQWPYWSQFWRDWDWTTISRTVDNLATMGVNCLQFTATGLDDGGVTHPNDATMDSRISQLAAYALTKGMALNPQLGYQPVHSFANGASVATAAAVRMAVLFAKHPNIVFIDAMNEVNLSAAVGWSGPNAQALSDITMFNAGVRGVIGGIPLTWSIGASAVADYAGAWSQAIAPFTDFHNLHTYTYNASGTTPTSADFDALRSAVWYKGRFVVGETGVPSQRGTALQTSWITGNGIVAQANDCLGSILWGATDTTGIYDVANFGLLDSTGTTFRTALSVPMAAWPGVL